jgi:hypothetical protein
MTSALLALSAVVALTFGDCTNPAIPEPGTDGPADVSGVSLNTETLSLAEGATTKLIAAVVPENAANEDAR